MGRARGRAGILGGMRKIPGREREVIPPARMARGIGIRPMEAQTAPIKTPPLSRKPTKRTTDHRSVKDLVHLSVPHELHIFPKGSPGECSRCFADQFKIFR